jgi:hypothetical protein
MSVPKDKGLYEAVKKRVYKRIQKHSAYRSGILVQEYKEAYKKKHGSGSAYEGKKESKKGLSRWFDEEWKNQRGGSGYKKKGDVYRPTKRITSETPKTFSELTSKELRKAMAQKKRKGKVSKF